MSIVWVALGSAIGGAGRYWVGSAICFLIGVVAAPLATESFLGSLAWRGFAVVGVLGGYRTFSAFSLQTLLLAENGQFMRTALYVLASVGLCLAGVRLGQLAGVALAR